MSDPVQQGTSVSAASTILILGGSYGGVSTAHYLLKHVIPALPNPASYQVILVSTSAQVFDRPASPRAMIAEELFDQNKLFVPIPKLFTQYPKGSFQFIQGTAQNLDHVQRTVSIGLPRGDSGSSESREIKFHALVIATGGSTDSPLLSLNGDENSLKTSWTTFRKALPSAKSILVAGGGPSGVETAGELGEYLNGKPGMFSSGKLKDPKVQITLVTSAPRILPYLRPSLAQRAESYLARVGVTVIKDAKVQSVTPEDAGLGDNIAQTAPSNGTDTAAVTVTLANGKSLNAHLYIPAFGTTPNTSFVGDKSLLAADGRIETNASTLRVDKAGPRIYAIGDASTYARPAIHNLFAAVPVLCANIKRDLLAAAAGPDSSDPGAGTGDGQDRLFKEDKRETQLVPIGTSKGVGAAMGWQIPSLLIWLIKGRDYWLWTTGDLWSGKQWAKAS